jgi:YggT family protein
MLGSIIVQVFNVFQFVMLGWIVMSWIPSFQSNKLYWSLDRFFSMVLAPIRKVIPPIGGTLDISPIILLLALQYLVVPLLLKIV